MSYQLGVFLQITNNKRSEWRKQVEVINNLSGVDFIEIWLEYLPTESEFKFLKKLIKNYSLNIHAPFIGLNFCSAFPAVNEASILVMEKLIDCAVKLKAKLVTYHGGESPFFWSMTKTIKTIKYCISVLSNYGRKKNIKVAIENVTGSKDNLRIKFPSSLEHLQIIYKSIPKVLFTLDIGHTLQSKENYKPFLKKHIKNICHIHLHDGEWGGKAHLEIGKGNFNFKDFFTFLKKIEYNQTISLEVWGEKVIRSSWKKIQEINNRQ
ncbi:MAG: sugar phosphate isomerase/epimerase family protein [Patescibacteria group bacterium]